MKHPAYENALSRFVRPPISARLALVFATGGLLLSGCAPFSYMRETSGVDVTGAYQITHRDTEQISLEALLTAYGATVPTNGLTCIKHLPLSEEERNSIRQKILDLQRARANSGDAPKFVNDKDTNYEDDYTTLALQVINNRDTLYSDSKIEMARAYFACRMKDADANTKKTVRNALQERLLEASQQRCNAYKGNLQRTFSRTNFGLGVLSTLSATAGALVTAPAAASNWAGGAAISSGVRAEFNQDFLANLAAHVIADGIDKRREMVYAKIQSAGQNKEYADYPVEAAIKDAIYFHGQCTVLAGFQEAGDAVKFANDPGLNQAITTAARLKAANNFLTNQQLTSAEEIMKQAGAITNAAPSLVGTKLQAPTAAYPTQYQLAIGSIGDTYIKLNKERKSIQDTLLADTVISGNDDLKSKVNNFTFGIALPADWDQLKKSCQSKIEKIAIDEATNLTKAGFPTISANDSAAAKDAAGTYNKQGSMLADNFLLLAKNYLNRTNDIVAKWQGTTQGVLASDTSKRVAAASTATFVNAPTLDDNLLKVASSLCN